MPQSVEVIVPTTAKDEAQSYWRLAGVLAVLLAAIPAAKYLELIVDRLIMNLWLLAAGACPVVIIGVYLETMIKGLAQVRPSEAESKRNDRSKPSAAA